MLLRLNPSAGVPLYLQIMQQIRLAVETGALRDGEVLPGIRTLAEELVISPNTVAKAYNELEHEGLLDLRHGSGAYICAKRRAKVRSEKLVVAQGRVRECIGGLRQLAVSDEEIRRLFEAELLYSEEFVRQL
jgi:GntR family transcriptional regulator